MNTFEQDLRTSLARRAEDGAAGTPLGLADVKGRARRIQRRRRGIAAGVAAAVAAVVVPGSLALAPAFDRTSEVPPVAPSTPSPAPTPDHARAGDGSLDFRDLPVGPDPAIGYLDLSGEAPIVVEPGGNETVLELEHEPTRYTDLEDGRYVVLTRDEEGAWYVEVTDSGGTTQQTYDDTGGFAVDEAHAQVAWGDADGAVRVLVAGEEEPRVLGEIPGFDTLTVTDLNGTECFRDAPPGTDFGCVAHVEATDGLGRAGGAFTMTKDEATPVEGTTEDYRGHADSIRFGETQTPEEVSYTAGMIGLGKDGVPCSQVTGDGPDEFNTRVQITTCEHVFDSFSTDARLLLAWGAEGDGAYSTMAVYDMVERDVLWERTATTAEMGRVGFAEWEDEEHLLAPVHQAGRWQLVRFSRDGAVERVTGQVPGDETDAPFVPEAQRSTP